MTLKAFSSKTFLISSTLESRLPIYPTTLIPSPRKEDGTWGSWEVQRGNLNIHHKKLLDAISVCRDVEAWDDSTGEIIRTFDLAEVREFLDVSTDWTKVRKLLVDVMTTVIRVKHPGQHWGEMFPILSWVGDANKGATRCAWQYPAQMKKIIYSAGICELYANEATVWMTRETVKKIIGFRYPINYSLVNWCLSHSSDQHHRLATVLPMLGACQAGEKVVGRNARSTVRNYVKQIKDEAERHSELGISIEGEWIHSVREEATGVFIKTPEKAPEALSDMAVPD